MKKLALGTVVRLDSCPCHYGIIGGYTIDKEFNEEAYLMAATCIDGCFELRDKNEDECIYIYPVEICPEASEEEKEFFFKKMMSV